MPRVRVILLTFRRPALLPRALDSLRRQTFTDWVCELHNGDPADPDPGNLLASLGDPRIQLVLPPRRTGPVEAFNLAHRPAPEEYQSLLEDDNWWEPDFLEKMVATLDAHPEVELAWSNMRVWRELPGNQWEDTGKCVWSRTLWTRPQPFDWPQLLHVSDILYSNGSMLLRSRAAGRLIMPDDTPRDMIEHTRERMMRYPILLVPEPLANFALTLLTFRSTDYTGWAVSQALLIGSFLRQVPLAPAARRQLWEHRRNLRPRSTGGLFYGALLAGRIGFLRSARPADWLGFFASCARHPLVSWATLRARKKHPSTWEFLNRRTAERLAEARARGFTALAAGTLVDKHEALSPPAG